MLANKTTFSFRHILTNYRGLVIVLSGVKRGRGGVLRAAKPW
jgi:hypothetical protein